MRRYLVLFAATLGFATSALPDDALADDAAAAEEVAENCAACEAVLDLSLAHPRRAVDRARDPSRQPARTLAFFRVRPGMTVVDYGPGRGWYTRILVPYLGETGRYIGREPGDAPLARDGTVDRVLILRELHNLQRGGMLARELCAAHALLKPDGLLGIEQHRARPDAPDAYADGSKGYLREKDVIAMIEAQGFGLVAKSEVNANPRDSADHPAGVWALPPSLRLGDVDRDRYRAIGESDRMTLLFRKRA